MSSPYHMNNPLPLDNYNDPRIEDMKTFVKQKLQKKIENFIN